jgi:hypothetical protein
VISRKRVIEYKDAGYTFKQVNEAFGVDSGGITVGRSSLRKPVPPDTVRQRNAGEKSRTTTKGGGLNGVL